ncbi:MAG: FIST C-terminal domain-containing protein [Deltaproteobacteria bacterium]|nr:FIST C-terminal domain-containing protein [Deltaproteobacteria bacterium]
MRDPQLVARRVVVSGHDPARAASEIARVCGAPAPQLVIVFATWRCDPIALAKALVRALPESRIIGCTTSGEIATGGDHEDTVVALSLASPSLRVGVGVAPELSRHVLRSSKAAVEAAAAELGVSPDALELRRHVAITMIDPRSRVQESFCLGVAATASRIHFVGGAASDGHADPEVTRVFCDGQVHADAAVVAILETTLPFAVLQIEHMIPTEIRTVVTGADPDRRLILELDGHPAATRYRALIARVGGPATVDDQVVASYPFATYIGGEPYVRSVMRIEGDALAMATAFDPGAVLRLMRAGDLVGTTDRAFTSASHEVGEAGAVIGFSCVARHIEATARGCRAELAHIYDRVPMIGFHSLGEQAGPLMGNHTLTGLVIGTGERHGG